MKVEKKTTNAEKLAKKLLSNIDDFAKILYHGICPVYQHCIDCPLHNAGDCSRSEIKEWLEREVEENGRS